MPDFSSALYLGLRHGSDALRPWTQLTLGVPAALGEPPGATGVARKLAALFELEDALLAPSTLHVAWALFRVLALDLLPRGRAAIYADAALYPIMQWGVERAAGAGVPVRRIRHYDPSALRSLLRAAAAKHYRPLIVTDGYCPDCGRLAPLAAYAALADECGGYLVIDDTQALGVFGARELGGWAPYGRGGGGSTRYAGLARAPVAIIASLAKAFGAPVATLAGPAFVVERYRAKSETRVHCSPPSVAAVRAAEKALQTNRERGDALRHVLAQRVGHFRARLADAGFAAAGGLFPVQTVLPALGVDLAHVHRQLSAAGIQTVAHAKIGNRQPRLSFIITARHDPIQLDQAIDALAEAARHAPAPRFREVTHVNLRTTDRSLRHVSQH